MFPYLDNAGFGRRTRMPSQEWAWVEASEPGYTAQQIALVSSFINARLRKRYGKAGVLPMGQSAPVLLGNANGIPDVSLGGRPTLGSIQVTIEITTAGALGVARFRYTLDAGLTWTTGATVGPGLAIAGMTITFPDLAYTTDMAWSAATPVPEVVLGWLTTLVTQRLYAKRGVNPQDPAIEWLRDDCTRAYDEIKEAADSDTGLIDIPTSEDAASAVVTGGPLGASDASPYAWQDRQACRGSAQDAAQGWRK